MNIFICDGINAVISFLRNDLIGALISIACIVFTVVADALLKPLKNSKLVTKVAEVIKDKFGSGVNKISSWITTAAQKLKNMPIIGSLFNKISSAFTSFKNWIKELFEKITVREGASGAVDDVVKEIPKPQKPNQVHHYATNKSKTYTKPIENITKKYDLDLDGGWNKDLLPHQGRHPNAYHDYVLNQIKQYDSIARGNKDVFIKLFDNLKNEVKANPDMLYKKYWLNK